MSVQTQLDRIKDTVSGQNVLIREIRTALEEKGGSGETENEGALTPLENNTVKLQGILQTVRDLPEVTEVKLQEKSIIPGTEDQPVLPDTGYDGLSEVTVQGDSNLMSGNIKEGVRIFGVDGSYEGVELNFEVVGGTSAPASPKENTIWINTGTAVSDYVFSATQPAAVSGRVWILTGTSRDYEFNALKKNEIQVYPISAKQYVSGAWVDKTVKSYQGGKWEDWITDLVIFEAGKGAVQAYATKKGTYEDSTITVSTSKIAVDGTDLVYYTKNKINTDGYKTLRLVGKFPEIDTEQDYTGFGLMSSVPIADNFGVQDWVSSKEIESPSSSSKPYDCSISGSGSYYFVFACAYCQGEITDIRLLK